MITITNPFTGQVTNANPEGHNQYVNPDGPSSKQSQVEGLIKLIRGEIQKKRRSLKGSYLNLRDESQVPIEFNSPEIEPSDIAAGRAEEDIIRVGQGLFDREAAAHEIGHHKIGWKPRKLRYSGTQFMDSEEMHKEEEAWKWALKNAKRLSLSKRKIERLSRGSLQSYRDRWKNEILAAPLK